MTDETPTHFRHVFIQIRKGFLKMELVKEVFIRITWRAMRRQPTTAKYRSAWQIVQILLPYRGELLTRPMYGVLGVLTEIVVEAEVTGCLIMIASNDDVAHLLDQFKTFIGVGIVPDNITQANHCLSMWLHICQHRFKCFKIG